MIKKITASLATAGLALALILSLILPNTAFAEQGSGTKVNAATATPKVQIVDADPTDSFTAYKVVDISNTGIYTFTQDFKDFLGTAKNTTAIKTTDAYQTSVDAEATKTLLSEYASYCVANNKIVAHTWTGSDPKEVALGQYVITGASTGKQAYVYAVMTASFPVSYNKDQAIYEVDPTVTINGKKTKPTIDKEITDKQANGSKDNQVGIGDTVNYQIITTIPTFPIDAIQKTYKIGDELTVGLTGHNNLKVYGVNTAGNAETLLTAGDDADTNEYKITTNSGQSLMLEFRYDLIKGYDKIKVTYDSTVTNQAVLGTEGNPNTATLYYSNNPYSNQDSTSEPDDKEKVYTYEIKVTKVDDGTNEGLQGAEFELYKDQACTQRVKLTGPVGNVYTVDAKNGLDNVKLVSDATGVINIHGIDVGTYYLKETKAAPGYHLPTGGNEIFTIEVTDANKDGIIDDDGDDKATPNNAIVEFYAENKKIDTTLPQTGGMGTTIFIIVGISGMAAAVILLAVNKKRAKNN